MQILISKEQIAERISELAAEISKEYEGQPLALVGVLRGCVPFISDLMRALAPELDVEVDFISVGSYGNALKSSGVVTIHKDTTSDLGGKHILIIDDIIDTGGTLAMLKDIFATRGLSVKCGCLLSKPSARVEQHKITDADFIGFEIENKYVVGYGLDAAQKYRNLPDIYTLED